MDSWSRLGSRGRAGIAALAAGAVAVLGAACERSPRIGFAVDVPGDVLGQATWLEVGAFTDASCEAMRPILAGGIPTGARRRVAFEVGATSPDVGDLPRATYAFAAVAKDARCAVLASGCVEVDVSDAKDVAITLEALDAPSGACDTGSTCTAARCVPKLDTTDPDLGRNCALDLVGSGPLASPPLNIGTRLSAPAVANTERGFLAAYREIENGGNSARVTLLPIDAGGGAGVPLRPLLGGRCAESEETDGVGLLIDGDRGRVLLGRSACGARPGLELLGFTTRPELELTADFRSSDAPTSQRLLLSAGHVAAQRSSDRLVVFTDDGTPRVATAIDAQGVVAPSGSFGGSGQTGAWIAASEGILALLAAGSGSGLRLYTAAADTAVTAFDGAGGGGSPAPPIALPGAWGVVGATGTRAIVASADGEGELAVRTSDLGARSATEVARFALPGGGKVTAADIVALDDRFFVAALSAGQIELRAWTGATATPSELRRFVFRDSSRLGTVAQVRDGRVAIAASPTRVAVVWTTASILAEGEPSGGYAVFACGP